jgi:hypothetical protein
MGHDDRGLRVHTSACPRTAAGEQVLTIAYGQKTVRQAAARALRQIRMLSGIAVCRGS